MAYRGPLNIKQRVASELRHAQQEVTTTDTVVIRSGTVRIVEAGAAVVLTLAYDELEPGDELLVTKQAGDTYSTVMTLPSGVTFDGTNDTATFDAPNETLLIRAVSATRFQIIANVGSVGLS